MIYYMYLSLILGLFLGAVCGASQSIVVSQSGAQIGLSEPQDANHAATYGVVRCLASPPVSPGLTVTLENFRFISDGTQAEVVINGTCAEGYITPSSKTMTCSYSTGWDDVAQCTIVKCPVDFGETSSSSCSGESDFNTVCTYTCSGSVVPRSRICQSSGSFSGHPVCKQGSISLCGSDSDGQLGNQTSDVSVLYPAQTLINSANGFSDSISIIRPSGRSTCVLTGGQKVICVGNNQHGQVKDSEDLIVTTPEMRIDFDVMSEIVVDFVASSASYSALLDSGRLFTWGYNDHHQLLRSDNHKIPLEVTFPDSRHAVLVKSSFFATVVVLDNGQYYGAGYNDRGAIVSPTGAMSGPQILDFSLPLEETSPMKGYYPGYSASLLLTESGNVYVKGTTQASACGTASGLTFTKNHASLQGNVEMFSCTYTSCLFFLKNGDIHMCSARNDNIPGHASSSSTPIDITTAANANCLPGKTVTKIESSYDITHFLWGECNPNKVFGICPGQYPYGVCSDDSTPISNSVVTVFDSDTPILDIQGGFSHAAIMT